MEEVSATPVAKERKLFKCECNYEMFRNSLLSSDVVDQQVREKGRQNNEHLSENDVLTHTWRVLHLLQEKTTSTKVLYPRRKYSISCVEIGHASRVAVNAWCCQFSLQNRLAASVGIGLNVTIVGYPSDTSLCVKRRKLTAGKSG